MHNISNPSWIAVFLLAVFFAMLFAAFGGLIYAFLTVTLRCNQNITGLALTTFGAGFTDYFMGTLTKRGFNYASVVLRRSLVDIFPSFGKLGWFADIFLSHGILVYIAIALAIIMAILLKKSRVGLNLRAVGENPATADAAGININAYKYERSKLPNRVACFSHSIKHYIYRVETRSCHCGIGCVRLPVRFQQLQFGVRH